MDTVSESIEASKMSMSLFPSLICALCFFMLDNVAARGYPHGHNGLLRFSGGADEGSIGHEGAINLKQKLSLIDDTDLWSPKVISTMNDYQLKVVKVQGDFTWHDHKDTDEVFIVIEGSLVIDIQGQDPVTLNEGEMYVVPKGVVHKPYARDLCKILLVEPSGVVNTGEVEDSELTATEQFL